MQTTAALTCWWHAVYQDNVHATILIIGNQSSLHCYKRYLDGCANCQSLIPGRSTTHSLRPYMVNVWHTCILPQRSIKASSLRYTSSIPRTSSDDRLFFQSYTLERPAAVSHSASLLHCHCNKQQHLRLYLKPIQIIPAATNFLMPLLFPVTGWDISTEQEGE